MKILQKIKQWIALKNKDITIWEGALVYPHTSLGFQISIGRNCEIGADRIGSFTRIGYGTFMPKGVTIGTRCFIGPMVCFTNDMYPPSPKSKWQKTIVSDGAAIGAGCVIRPGITIGENALVGCGSVVTKDIPANEIWAGNPAKPISNNKKVNK